MIYADDELKKRDAAGPHMGNSPYPLRPAARCALRGSV